MSLWELLLGWTKAVDGVIGSTPSASLRYLPQSATVHPYRCHPHRDSGTDKALVGIGARKKATRRHCFCDASVALPLCAPEPIHPNVAHTATRGLPQNVVKGPSRLAALSWVREVCNGRGVWPIERKGPSQLRPNIVPGTWLIGLMRVVQDHRGPKPACKVFHLLPALPPRVLRFSAGPAVEHVEVMAAQHQDAMSSHAQQVRLKVRLLNQDALFLARHRVGLPGPSNDLALVEVHHAHQFGPRVAAAANFRLAIPHKINANRQEA